MQIFFKKNYKKFALLMQIYHLCGSGTIIDKVILLVNPAIFVQFLLQ